MGNLILVVAGIAIALAGGLYLARLMYFKKNGVIVKAEVVSVKEVTRKKGRQVNGYAHTLKYEMNGKTYEEQDKAGYSEPLKVGSTHLLMCDPKDPKVFKFEADIDSHIKVAAALIAAGVIFAGRFAYAYMK
ncbi:MAG: DUF3592 domain-containing protein [Ruminococcus sp.]|uniref:DUF3592 domain-containing protein n=1 Tax=Ruminococcus sp. TaxID=41978 RepID=UPI0025EA4BE8|nr:DUF3592 domain-containing protein [Ruminococcus sp.]MCR5599568.1 DUF3592 domain-containing protein [Ruminococcus sp.]